MSVTIASLLMHLISPWYDFKLNCFNLLREMQKYFGVNDLIEQATYPATIAWLLTVKIIKLYYIYKNLNI